MSFSADGLHFAAWRKPADARVYQTATGKEIGKLEGQHAGAVVEYAVLSPDGQRVALASTGPATISVRDIATGRQLFALGRLSHLDARGGTDLRGEGNVVFSPDGKRLAIAVGMEVNIYAADSGKFLLKVGQAKKSPWSPVTVLAFSTDGKRLAAASDHADDRAISV